MKVRLIQYFIVTVLLFSLILPLITSVASSQSINVNFSVTSNGYVTVFLSGIPQNNNVTLHYGIESGPQQAWSQVFNSPMTWNGKL